MRDIRQLFAGAAFGFALVPFMAVSQGNDQAAGTPDVIIMYGDLVNLAQIEVVVPLIEERGVSVLLTSGLSNPNCAAILNGKGIELYRFGAESIGSPTLGVVAYRVGAGKRISARAESDCPVQDIPPETQQVILRYGANIENIDLVSDDMASLGILVILEAGYSNPDCGEVQIGDTTVGFSQIDIYNGKVGAYIQTTASGGQKLYYLPSCDNP